MVWSLINLMDRCYNTWHVFLPPVILFSVMSTRRSCKHGHKFRQLTPMSERKWGPNNIVANGELSWKGWTNALRCAIDRRRLDSWHMLLTLDMALWRRSARHCWQIVIRCHSMQTFEQFTTILVRMNVYSTDNVEQLVAWFPSQMHHSYVRQLASNIWHACM